MIDNDAVTNIFKFSKLASSIYIDNIWFFNGKYVCKWKVKKILFTLIALF